jgi:hypothetical protein
MKNTNKWYRGLGRDLKSGPSEYKEVVVSTHLRNLMSPRSTQIPLYVSCGYLHCNGEKKFAPNISKYNPYL